MCDRLEILRWRRWEVCLFTSCPCTSVTWDNRYQPIPSHEENHISATCSHISLVCTMLYANIDLRIYLPLKSNECNELNLCVDNHSMIIPSHFYLYKWVLCAQENLCFVAVISQFLMQMLCLLNHLKGSKGNIFFPTFLINCYSFSPHIIHTLNIREEEYICYESEVFSSTRIHLLFILWYMARYTTVRSGRKSAQYIRPKRWYPSSRLCDVVTHKTVFCIFWTSYSFSARK
jgi:hypothetical protein